MPKNLTEADTFDATIQVPVGTDSRNQAAQDVERVAQGLANRTHYLHTHAGLLAANQQWTGTNQYAAALSTLVQALIQSASLDVAALKTATAGNPTGSFTCHLELRIDSGHSVYVYTGADSIDLIGALFIVVNAHWAPGGGAGTWSQVDGTKPSCALIMRSGNTRVVGFPSGQAPWAAWPQTTIGAFGSTLMAEVMQASRTLVTGNTDADQTQGFRYANAVARTSPIRLGSCWGNVQVNAAGHIRRNTVTAEFDQVWFPIAVPTYCTFSEVRVHFFQLQGGTQPDQFQLMKRTSTNGWATVGSAEVHNNYGEVTGHFHTGGPQLVKDGEEWAYRWKVVSGDPASIDNRLVGLELDWSDIGPSNRIG